MPILHRFPQPTFHLVPQPCNDKAPHFPRYLVEPMDQSKLAEFLVPRVVIVDFGLSSPLEGQPQFGAMPRDFEAPEVNLWQSSSGRDREYIESLNGRADILGIPMDVWALACTICAIQPSASPFDKSLEQNMTSMEGLFGEIQVQPYRLVLKKNWPQIYSLWVQAVRAKNGVIDDLDPEMDEASDPDVNTGLLVGLWADELHEIGIDIDQASVKEKLDLIMQPAIRRCLKPDERPRTWTDEEDNVHEIFTTPIFKVLKLLDLIRQMTRTHPRERPDTDAILKHEWFGKRYAELLLGKAPTGSRETAKEYSKESKAAIAAQAKANEATESQGRVEPPKKPKSRQAAADANIKPSSSGKRKRKRNRKTPTVKGSKVLTEPKRKSRRIRGLAPEVGGI